MIHPVLALSLLLGALTVAQVSPDAGQTPASGGPATPAASGEPATPSATATPPATATSNPAPTPAYRFIYRPAAPASPDPAPNAGPVILEIDLTDQVLVLPTELNVRVLTGPSVVAVAAETLGHTIALPEVQQGLFGFSTTLRAAPNSLRNRTFDVDFVASDAGGHTTTVSLPLTLR